MKSPLVEALRQASGSDSPSEQPEPESNHDEKSVTTELPPENEVAESSELQLMETSGILPIDGAGILPIDGAGILPIDGAGILPIDGADNVEDEECDAEFYETSSLHVANDEHSREVATNPHEYESAPFIPVANTRRRSSIARLGLYSPLICVAFAALAAGFYSFYQSLGASSRGSQLTALSSRGGPSAEQGGATTAESDNVNNRFKLLVNDGRNQP